MSTESAAHQRWSEELPAFLLGALSPEEEAECRRHVEGCVVCEAEARRLAPAVERLSQDVPRVEPPPALRERLLAEVRADARATAPRGAAPARSSWFGGRLGGWRLAGALAGIALVAVLVGYLVGTSDGGDPATSTVIAGKPPGVVATVVRSGDAATLRLANVAPLPSSRVLQAWVRRDGEVEPVQALFVPDRDGRATTTIADMSGVDAVMVTSEPRGGSRAPTSAPIATVAIRQ